MSFWDGTRWVDDDLGPAPAGSRTGTWAATAVMILGLVALMIPFGATSAASRHRFDPPCTINPSPVSVNQTYVVSVTGLPIDKAINLWVTDPTGGVTGSPIGGTSDGTFSLSRSSAFAGMWTYTFKGADKQNAATTPVYATCSVDAY